MYICTVCALLFIGKTKKHKKKMCLINSPTSCNIHHHLDFPFASRKKYVIHILHHFSKIKSPEQTRTPPRARRAPQDKVEDLEALENGNGHVVWPRSETAKTVSQTGTPASKSGTPTSSRSVAPLTYVARRPSRAGSMSSSYLDSGEVDPQGRQPSARIRNEA